MSFTSHLALQNIRRKPLRSVTLMLLAAFLAFSVFAGSLVVMSLQNGLKSYEARLGADVVVVPAEAGLKGGLESILLQGVPGYFYMDGKVMEKIGAMDGVAALSPQFFLATAKASCCSFPIQLIGFDPESDFTIQPWIRESYAGTVGEGDILIGNHVSMPTDGVLTFYGQEMHVVGQLDETGTALDNAVYGSLETMRGIVRNAENLGYQYLGKVSAETAVSAVMIRVAEGYTPEDVCNNINIHVRKVDATQSKSMVTGIAGGLSHISKIVGVLTVLIWALALGIMAVAFVLIVGERKKEFSILRVVGASRKMLSRMLLTEAALVSGFGALCGVALAALVALPFTGLIRDRLGLPYLLPGAGTVAALALGALLLSVAAGAASAAIAGRKLNRIDAGLVLREGA